MYAVPCAAEVPCTCRGGGVWRGAFFFLGPRMGLGTPKERSGGTE